MKSPMHGEGRMTWSLGALGEDVESCSDVRLTTWARCRTVNKLLISPTLWNSWLPWHVILGMGCRLSAVRGWSKDVAHEKDIQLLSKSSEFVSWDRDYQNVWLSSQDSLCGSGSRRQVVPISGDQNGPNSSYLQGTVSMSMMVPQWVGLYSVPSSFCVHKYCRSADETDSAI